MKPEKIEKLIKKMNVIPDVETDRMILNDALLAQEESKKQKTAFIWPDIGRIIMKSRITKLAAAAVIIIAAGLSISIFDRSIPSAYALAQTIQANKALRYLHTKYLHGEDGVLAKECWLEFNEFGQVKKLRINWSAIYGDEVVVWDENKTTIWNHKNDLVTTFNDEIYNSRINKMMEADDPKTMVDDLYYQETKGLVKIEIDESGTKTDPIIVTATYLANSPKYGDRKVLFIDSATKLTTTMELYVLKEGEYTYYGTIEYFDYNMPIDRKIFSLTDEVPKNVHLIDTGTQDIGLEQGRLTDEEIATKVVQEFIEALIAKDYAKASQLLGGLSQDKIENGWGKLNIIHLVSVGSPIASSKPSKIFPKMLSVPYMIEIEKDGKKVSVQRQQNVRRVLGRRGRWMIN